MDQRLGSYAGKWHPKKRLENKKVLIIPNAINLKELDTNRESIRK